jgi:hypothetical protein
VVAERGFSRKHYLFLKLHRPVVFRLVRPWWVVLLHGPVGVGLYRLSAEQLRVECSEPGLNCSGPVRVLRRRLAEYLRSGPMDHMGENLDTQASVPAGIETSTPF